MFGNMWRKCNMNNWVGSGRLTKEPEVRYSAGSNPQAVARYTLAVERRFKRDGQPDADFISCVAFGRPAEFAEKYLTKGMKILVRGEIRTGSYTNKEGKKIYTTDVVIENQEFAESKKPQDKPQKNQNPVYQDYDGFMDVKPGEMDELAFV